MASPPPAGRSRYHRGVQERDGVIALVQDVVPPEEAAPLVEAFEAGEEAAVQRVASIQAEVDPQGQAVRTLTAVRHAGVLAPLLEMIRLMERHRTPALPM